MDRQRRHTEPPLSAPLSARSVPPPPRERRRLSSPGSVPGLFDWQRDLRRPTTPAFLAGRSTTPSRPAPRSPSAPRSAQPSLADALYALEQRLARAEERAEREEARSSRLESRVHALEGELATALDAAVSGAAADAKGGGDEVKRLRLRVQALETAGAARKADAAALTEGGGDAVWELAVRVEAMEGVLKDVRGALAGHAEASGVWAAHSRATDERASRTSEQLSAVERRVRGVSGRLEALEMGLTAASEGAHRAEQLALSAQRTAERAQSAPPAMQPDAASPAAGALPMLRLLRAEQALGTLQAESETVREDAQGARAGCDALSLVVETFVQRVEALEQDVATALSTVADQLADEARGSGRRSSGGGFR